MKVLVIGSGAREHCLAWKISRSPLVREVFCAPGNAGTGLIARNIDRLSAGDVPGITRFAEEEKIDLTVVGPEAPLVEGIADSFKARGLSIFGPGKGFARLEGSKVFSKTMMKKYGIPTADFEVFDDPGQAVKYVEKKGAPIVIKADGLAGGKGVYVARTMEQAFSAIEELMVKKAFGTAGEKIVIEECLAGEEVSLLVITDGETILPLVSSQDHKRVFDDDKGPNTGGMGAYAPAPLMDPGVFRNIQDKILSPVYEMFRREKEELGFYRGVLYFGLMIKDGHPYLLEFNARFGDPETQVVIPKLKSDIVPVMLAAVEGRLKGIELEWDSRSALCVVLAAGGYPGKYSGGYEITGLDKVVQDRDLLVFHSGTARSAGNNALVTAGGRVLNVVGLAPSLSGARERVYAEINKINFSGMHYRHDIGNKALKFLSELDKIN